MPLHLVPREREVKRPSDLALVLARSYARYLCRTHGAQTAEIVRLTRVPVPPGVIFGTEQASSSFDTLVVSFGEMSR